MFLDVLKANCIQGLVSSKASMAKMSLDVSKAKCWHVDPETFLLVSSLIMV